MGCHGKFKFKGEIIVGDITQGRMQKGEDLS